MKNECDITTHTSNQTVMHRSYNGDGARIDELSHRLHAFSYAPAVGQKMKKKRIKKNYSNNNNLCKTRGYSFANSPNGGLFPGPPSAKYNPLPL